MVEIIRVKATKTKGSGEYPVGYWMEGFGLLPRSGEPWTVDRYIRNGILMPGIFTTSRIKEVHFLSEKQLELITRNSTWLVDILESSAD